METCTLKNLSRTPIEVVLKSKKCRFLAGKQSIDVAKVEVDGAPMVKKLEERGLLQVTVTGKVVEKKEKQQIARKKEKTD